LPRSAFDRDQIVAYSLQSHAIKKTLIAIIRPRSEYQVSAAAYIGRL